MASLLLGSRLLNPHFVPPADVATNAFVASGALVASIAATPDFNADYVLLLIAFIGTFLVFVAAVVVLFLKRPHGTKTRVVVLALQRER